MRFDEAAFAAREFVGKQGYPDLFLSLEGGELGGDKQWIFVFYYARGMSLESKVEVKVDDATGKVVGLRRLT